MFKTYEATLNHGQLQWLNEQPNIESARVIVTIMEELKPRIQHHPPASIAGKAKTIGDIISPITDEEDWECLK